MQYKALICDVDGTLIPNRKNAFLSEKVKQAITKASGKIFVGLATTRSLFLLPEIVKGLQLSGPSVVNAGAEIVNLSTREVLIEHLIQNDDLDLIIKKLEYFDLEIRIDNGNYEYIYNKQKRDSHIMKVFAMSVPESISDRLIYDINLHTSIAAHKVPSWDAGKFDVFFTNSHATKLQGTLEVARLLDISMEEIIGIGDGHNDFPFIRACGLKIAMGNAVDDLKAIADYIAPSAEEDGVADVIQRFIL